MHESNRYYGHEAILRAYAGETRPRAVSGVVQHGWTPFEWLYAHRGIHRHLPMFVWNERVRRETRDAGASRVTATGSPFAYLLELLPEAEVNVRSQTLVLPYHGLSQGDETSTITALLEQIRDAHGLEDTVVYLHANEVTDQRIQAVCRDAGVECRSFWQGRASLYDPYLLVRQIATFRRARRVISNALCTPLWYAALLGAEPMVFGQPPAFNESSEHADRAVRVARANWPYMFDGDDYDSGGAFEAARHELGVDLVMPPAELAMTVGLDSMTRSALTRLGTGAADARRRLRVRRS